MTRRLLLALAALLFLTAPAFPQHAVNLADTYERVLAVVPMVGSGTDSDPLRPMFAPAPSAVNPSRDGIIAYQFVASEDGKTALVEFVATSSQAFAEILDSKDAGVKVFKKGKDTKDDIEKEFKKYRKDFNLNQFFVRVP